MEEKRERDEKEHERGRERERERKRERMRERKREKKVRERERETQVDAPTCHEPFSFFTVPGHKAEYLRQFTPTTLPESTGGDIGVYDEGSGRLLATPLLIAIAVATVRGANRHSHVSVCAQDVPLRRLLQYYYKFKLSSFSEEW